MVVFVIGQWSRLIRHINIKNLHLWKIQYMAHARVSTRLMKGSVTLKCWNNYIKFDLYPNGVSLKSAIEEQLCVQATGPLMEHLQ